MTGRAKEIKILDSLCNDNKTNLAVVTGRRGIGKKYLIEEMFSNTNHSCLYFSFTGAHNADNKTQLINFNEAIYDWFKIETNEVFTSWTQAFNKLKRIINNEISSSEKQYKKVVIFIDELPWIDRNNKTDFSTALGHFYNTYCVKQKNFLVIFCGSNAAWIKNRILEDEQGPYHKRVDKLIELKPFTLEETALYLKEEKNLTLDNKTITEIYMIFGGVAKYLSYYDRTKTLAKNVNEIFFSFNGLLYGEYELLFKSLFIDKDGTYRKIIQELVKIKSGLTRTDITNKLKVPASSTKIRDAINDLVMSGFTISISKSQNAYRDTKYIISDPFILFYSKWVLPLNKNDIVQKNNYWESIMSSNTYNIWAGFAFELVCIINIEKYVHKRGLSGVFKKATYWHHTSKDKNEKGAQIDILVEYEHDCYDIVECKYYNDEVTITADMKKNLINKKDMFTKYGLSKKKFDIKTIFISPYGVKENNHYNSVPIFDNFTLNCLL